MLSDHWDGGFLSVGWHKVTITDVKFIEYNSGNQGAEYALQSEDGSKGKTTFPLVESILFRLAGFLRATGLTREQAKSFAEKNLNHHRRMIGRMVQVQVVLGSPRGDPPKRYAEVDTWLPMEQTTLADEPPPEHVAPVEEDKGDEVPF